MPQLTIPVNAPVLIPNSGSAELFGLNIGVTTLYYGPDLTVSVATGTPLSPGNAIQNWPVGEPLYITSAVGPGTFSYQSNGSQIAIGATTATVNNPISLASGTSLGTLAANNPNVLGVSSTTYGLTAQSNSPLNPITSMSLKGYSSVILTMNDGTLNTLSAANIVVVSLTQYLNGFQVDFREPVWLLTGTGCYCQIPVVGDTLAFSGYFTKGATAQGGPIQIQCVGSSEIISQPRYVGNYNNAAGGQGIFVNTGSTAGSQIVNSSSGAATFSVLAASGTANGSGNLQYVNLNAVQTVFAGTGSIGAGSQVTIQTQLPMAPIVVAYNPTALSIITTLTQSQ